MALRLLYVLDGLDSAVFALRVAWPGVRGRVLGLCSGALVLLAGFGGLSALLR